MCSADIDVRGKGGKTFMVKLRSLFGKLWHQDGPEKLVQHERPPRAASPQIATVATMTEQLKQLKILKNHERLSESDEDIVVTKVTTARHSSNDSGYSDKNDDDDDDSFKTVQICVAKNSKIEEDAAKTVDDSKNEREKNGAVDDSAKISNAECKKTKQLKKVYLSRQPIRNKAPLPSIGPYTSRPQQFHQVNHQTFSGCQVTINNAADTATSDIENIKYNLLNQTHAVQSPNANLTNNDQEQIWSDLISVIENDIVQNDEITNFITELVTETDKTPSEELNSNTGLIPSFGISDPSVYNTGPQETTKDFVNWTLESIDSNTSAYKSPESDQMGNWNLGLNLQYNSNMEPSFDYQPVCENQDLGLEVCNSNLNAAITSKPALFLTPPPSNESAPSTSPNNRSRSDFESMYSPNRDYSSDISIRNSPPIQAEYEVFQAIQSEDIPKCVEAKIAEKKKEKKKEVCTMNLKQYKEVMKKMKASFAGLPCCKKQDNEDLSKECYKKLSLEDRRQMILVLASCSLEAAYGLLYKLLESLSTRHDREDFLLATFVTICNRVRDEKPELYLSEFGLDLLAACCLACPSRHRLARHLVSCVRTALRTADVADRRSFVFDTVDTSGDNLIGACARRGDACAMALYELTNHGPGETPLFDVDHVNSEGLSALHLACSCSDTTPRVQTVHVLLAHARADLWKKDIKSGDLALHHAMRNSPTVLALAMSLFLHVDNARWFSLAKAKNYSSLTPLLKAKGAAATTADDSPISQVYLFLTKCRPKTTSSGSETYLNASY